MTRRLPLSEMSAHCEAVIAAAKTGKAKPYKLAVQEQSEGDIQSAILHALGRQDVRMVAKRGRYVAERDGLYKRPGCVFWRANCGGLSITGRPMRGNPSGTADILGVVGGRSVALEVKTRTGKQRESQAHWQAAWEAAGGLYAIVRSVGEAVRAVEGYLQIRQ